jgi:hypothetical protein
MRVDCPLGNVKMPVGGAPIVGVSLESDDLVNDDARGSSWASTISITSSGLASSTMVSSMIEVARGSEPREENLDSTFP